MVDKDTKEQKKIKQEARKYFRKISSKIVTSVNLSPATKQLVKNVFVLGYSNGFTKGYIARDRLEYKGNGKYE